MLIPFDNSFARLGDAFYARCDARKVGSPTLIRVNRKLAKELGDVGKGGPFGGSDGAAAFDFLKGAFGQN